MMKKSKPLQLVKEKNEPWWSAQKLSNLFFLLSLLFLPTQLGKHFWPPYAFVLGLRVDYLSAVVYFTDILLLLLFATIVLQHGIRQSLRHIRPFLTTPFFLFSFAIGLFHLLFTPLPFLTAYAVWKITEMVLFGFVVQHFFSTVSLRTQVQNVLGIAVVFEGGLALLQYLSQRSLGGLFYFFGERAFTSATPGIANANINGQLLLRPYGTFPHPNVLAGFFLIILIILAIERKRKKISQKRTILFLCIFFAGSLGVFLSMSRIAIVLWGCLVLLFLWEEKKNGVWLLSLMPLLGGAVFLSLTGRLTHFSLFEESVTIRATLLTSTWEMIQKHFFFGVGPMHFLHTLPHYLPRAYSFSLLQPVHNTFFLLTAETGFLGLFLFLSFIGKTLQKILRGSHKTLHKKLHFSPKGVLLLTVLVLGLFDHYFLTLQQGQLLLAVVFGYCYAKDK